MSQASRGHDHRDAQGGGASTGRGGLDRSMVRQRGRWTPAQRAQRVRWLLAHQALWADQEVPLSDAVRDRLVRALQRAGLVAPQTASANVDVAALIHSAREHVAMTSRAAWYDQ